MSKKTETVKVTVTVELPKNVHKLLENFAAFAGVSLEDILRDEIEKSLSGFWQSEMFQAWAKTAIKNAGCAEYFEIRE
jgi:hypothetical protein